MEGKTLLCGGPGQAGFALSTLWIPKEGLVPGVTLAGICRRRYWDTKTSIKILAGKRNQKVVDGD
jgi:hypothetical protein